MTSADRGRPPDVPGDAGATPSWRERAVERSLREARAKAEDRSDRFLAAATELLGETGSPDFAVHQLVERTRMSLRSFYQHFRSKDELLLVLFQEALRDGVVGWRRALDQLEGPTAKMRTVVETLYGAPSSTSGGTEQRSMRALALYHLQLADQRPKDFALVVAPLKELLLEIVGDGVAAGDFRADLGVEPLAVLVLQSLISSTIFSVLQDDLMDEPLGPAQLWPFLSGALAAGAAPGAADVTPSPDAEGQGRDPAASGR